MQVTLAANAVEDNILHLNASIDKPSVMYVRRKATWLESENKQQSAVPISKKFHAQTHLVDCTQVMNLTHTLCLQLLATPASLS